MARVNGDCSSTWSYPLEQDGWYHAHNALRADMGALEGMLASFQSQIAEDKPITPSQKKAATTFVNCFISFLHHHHYNEDDVAIPYLATRVEVPVKIGADHKRLELLMDRFEKETRLLLATSSLDEQRKLLAAITEVFGELHPLCLEHFKEEEEGTLPLVRQHFTRNEFNKQVVSKILRSMDGNGIGSFFRPMTREQRRAFARQEGIPFFIRWILFHKAAKYKRNVWQPFERECLATAVTVSA